MKRIAIFCDGTWNRADARTPTHVVRLAQAVRPTATDGYTQVVFYQPGVGSGRGSNKLARWLDRLFGGAFGWGLDDNVVEAYRNLVFTYEPGDQIFIFGFSRGAYTARSLAGLIRTAGIPPSDRTDHLPQAMAQYRARGPDTHPDSGRSIRFRAGLSPGTATSQKDVEWRLENGLPDTGLLTINYLGVWDTVGALGLPNVLGLLAKLVNQHYAFHDAALSRSVRGARHAVAIDERRLLFPPALWDNLTHLNGETTGGEAPYRQEWFPGNHGIVGGSGRVPALSAFPTAWIAEGARDRLLDFDRTRLQAIVGQGDVGADDKGAAARRRMGNLLGLLLRDRRLQSDPVSGAIDAGQVSAAARDRVRRSDYRPRTLDPVLDELIG